jgi:hypothetical protein
VYFDKSSRHTRFQCNHHRIHGFEDSIPDIFRDLENTGVFETRDYRLEDEIIGRYITQGSEVALNDRYSTLI